MKPKKYSLSIIAKFHSHYLFSCMGHCEVPNPYWRSTAEIVPSVKIPISCVLCSFEIHLSSSTNRFDASVQLRTYISRYIFKIIRYYTLESSIKEEISWRVQCRKMAYTTDLSLGNVDLDLFNLDLCFMQCLALQLLPVISLFR